jgi:RimJ/RimL family protein N-acetyltransferase
MCAAMASWAFEEVGFHRLDLEHAVGNTASCRVAEKTGFAAEGVRRSACPAEVAVTRYNARPRHEVHVLKEVTLTTMERYDRPVGIAR